MNIPEMIYKYPIRMTLLVGVLISGILLMVGGW